MVINMGDQGEVKRFSDEDKPIISFAIKNIILELVETDSSLYKVELNNIQNNLAVVFCFNMEVSSDDIKEKNFIM